MSDKPGVSDEVPAITDNTSVERNLSGEVLGKFLIFNLFYSYYAQ